MMQLFIALGFLTIEFLFFHYVQKTLAVGSGQERTARHAAILKIVLPLGNFLPPLIPAILLASAQTFGQPVGLSSALNYSYILDDVIDSAVEIWAIWLLINLLRPYTIALTLPRSD